jgi:hypothetical protein
MVEIAIIGNGSHGRMLKAIFKDQADFFMPDNLPDEMFVCIGIGNVPEIGKSDLKRGVSCLNNTTAGWSVFVTQLRLFWVKLIQPAKSCRQR